MTWLCTRQGAIATSTYTSETAAMKTATEEAISIRYMLRALGVPVQGRTALWGDNMGSLITTDNPGRECNAAGIIDVLKVDTANHFSDPFTKVLGTTHFLDLFQHIYRSQANVDWSQQGEKTIARSARNVSVFHVLLRNNLQRSYNTPFTPLP
jgi:hypothetical protein